MKHLMSFILGIALTILGVFLLLSNIHVSSLSFYSLGNLNSAPILIILLIVFIITAVASDKNVCWILVFVDIVLILLSVILGTRFTFAYMSALDLVSIICVFAVGLGLVLRGLVNKNKEV